MKRAILLGLCLAATLSLGGCSFPTFLFFEPPQIDTPAPAGTPATSTDTIPPTPTNTPIPPTEIPCAFAWANNPLPDETAVLQEALKTAGLGTVEAVLTAYGENCIDTQHNKVLRFSALQTDFFFTIPVADLRDKVSLGNWALKVLRVAQTFPPGKVPGPNLGQCTLTFQDQTGQAHLNFSLDTARKLLETGVSGEVLYTALSVP